MEKAIESRLSDVRLDRVLDKISDRISQKQTVCLRALADTRREEVQFGRFVGNDKVSVAALQQQLYAQLKGEGLSTHCLLIEDTTKVSFSLQRAIQGLGKVDKGLVQGFYLHPVLCIDAQYYGCLGLAALEFINRPWPDKEPSRQQRNSTRSKTAFEHKEGYRWLSSIKQALLTCPESIMKTVVADREADIYPLLTGLAALKVHYIIRARFDRPTDEGKPISQIVESWPVEYQYQIAVPSSERCSAHQAQVAVKYGKLKLKQPFGKSLQAQPSHHPTYLVEVKELAHSAVNDQQPIHWVLLTSHIVDKLPEALRIIEWYKQRWNVEQVFRLLKSKGLGLESSQVDSYEKLQKLTILALLAAVKVLQLLKARDDQTQQAICCVLDKQEQNCLLRLNQQLQGKSGKLQNPHPIASLAFAAWVVARLAGWSGYKSQRPPGPIDLLNGLKRFEQIYQGYRMISDNSP